MIKIRVTYLSLCLFLLGCFLELNAQAGNQGKRPLSTVIANIESAYEVNFTYADKTLENKFIVPPPANLSLNGVLRYLEAETGLLFEILSNSNIVIRAPMSDSIGSTQFLDEVLVTNYLTRGISLKKDGVTSVEPQKLGILPGSIDPDVLQTIQALPGVTSVDERVSNINIRGGTNDQNLILWDGIKMYQSGHFFGLISAFNPYLTEHVIVSKNGTSAMYGDGVSSIIDMRNPDEVTDELELGAGINLISADAFTRVPLSQKAELQLSARRSVTDILTTPTYDKYFKRIFQDTDLTNRGANSISQNERFFFYDTSVKFLYNMSEKDRIRVNGLAIYNNLDYDERSVINDVNEALNSKLIQRNLASGITYERDWSERLSTSAQVFISNYKLDATNFDLVNDQRLIQENEVYDTGIKLHLNYELDDNLNYFGGYQFNENGISNLEDVNNPVFRRFIKEVLRTHAVFNEISFRSNSGRTNARLGLRGSYIEKFSEFYLEPRFSFNHRFADFFRFEVLGEFKNQTTSQIIDLQNDFLGVEKRRWVLSNNSNIPVIQSKQLSAGLSYNRKGLLISLEAYYKEVEGITTRSQGFQNQYQFVNAIGEYKISGFDFLINKQWADLSTWLSYTFSKNDYLFENLNFENAFPNNFDIRHNLSFATTYNWNQFKFAIGLNWRTGKPFTRPNPDNPVTNNFINYDSPNAENITDYLRIDLSATYDFKLRNMDAELGFSLWNILDRINTINTYFIIDDADEITRIDNESLGITPNLSFRIKI